MKIKVDNPEVFTRRLVYLAYQASRVFGLGVIKAKDSATEDEVWQNAITRGDYAYNPNARDGEVSADYVFGRMMKLHIQFDRESIHINPRDFSLEYQSFYLKYPTPTHLADATAESLNTTYTVV